MRTLMMVVGGFRIPSASPSANPAEEHLRVSQSRRDRWYLLGLAAVYVLLYGLFYPLIYTSIDEADTFSMAYVLRHGTLFPPAAYNVPELNPIGAHGNIYRFPIGFPAVLSLLTFIGWRTFFLLNPILHLAATWAFARLLASQRVSSRWAGLYLFYPPFVLFARTLFSDLFAASLTTLGLFFLLRRRTAWVAGLCLGLAILSRSVSVFTAAILFVGLAVDDWHSHRGKSFAQGRSLPFLLGLLPFFLLALAYNAVITGNPAASTYAVHSLSLAGLHQSGPEYLLSLLLLFPGLLLAPFVYRGVFWKEGLVTTTLVVAIAAAYNESTYGNNFLQTLLSTPRQVLPVMPFYLLAYCGVLARWLPEKPLRRARVIEAGGLLLFFVAAGISFLHQKYLHSLMAMQAQITQSLPVQCAVYANKDVYKLHQPIWDRRTYRELPYVSVAQAETDLQRKAVYVVLSVRTRGFSSEDENNARVIHDLRTHFLLTPESVPGGTDLQFFRVTGVHAIPARGSRS